MIELTVTEKSKDLRNKIVGTYEFSLESIYQMENHSVLH